MADANLYCTAAEAKQAALITDDERLPNLTAKLGPAAREIDDKTGRWWDLRTLTIKTEAWRSGQRELFLPAPPVTLTSVTVDGSVVTADDDSGYIVMDKGHWLEMADGSDWPTTRSAVVLVGTFGCTTVPPFIREAAADITAMMAGLKVRSYTSTDGLDRTVIANDYAAWIKDRLGAKRWRTPAAQQWRY